MYATRGTSLSIYGPDGVLTGTRAVEPDERLLACSGLSGVLAFRPEGGPGEQWVLRAFTASGSSAPRITYPEYRRKPRRMGTYYTSGSGHRLRRACPAGLRRSEFRDPPLVFVSTTALRVIILSGGGTVLYATSQSAGLVGSDGEVMVTFAVRGTIWAVTWEGDHVAVCQAP